MTKLVLPAALTLAIWAVVYAQNAPATAATPQQPMEPVAQPTGLSDLEKATFACPRAALNAAARAVATRPSLGTYQFSYFNIASGSHHAAYEVHFTSNYAAEPVLKYCVTLYCQQGFDPATTPASVTLMGAAAATHATGAGHAANACAPPRAPAARRPTR